LDALLSETPYIVGKSLSIADIPMAVLGFWLFTQIYGEKTVAAYPNVLKWYTSVSTLPQFTKYLGKTYFLKEDFEI